MAQSDLRRVGRAAEKLDQAQVELRAAILNAKETGESYRDIATWANVTHQRIFQIVQEEEAKRPNRSTPE